jgi:amidase
VVSHAVPKLGFLSPNVPFEELMHRIETFTAFTPLHNATGSPAISVPGGLSRHGLPIGVHFSAAHGGEGVLLDLAYQLEAEVGFPTLA